MFDIFILDQVIDWEKESGNKDNKEEELGIGVVVAGLQIVFS